MSALLRTLLGDRVEPRHVRSPAPEFAHRVYRLLPPGSLDWAVCQRLAFDFSDAQARQGVGASYLDVYFGHYRRFGMHL